MKKILTWLLLYYFRFWARLTLVIAKPYIIGITGSVGKSSLRNAVWAILKDKAPTKVISHGNSETGISLGILGMRVKSLGFQTPVKSVADWGLMFLAAPLGIFRMVGTRYLIVEMGVDEPNPPKNMTFLLSIVQPDLAVFLNAYPVHTQQFDHLIPDQVQGEERQRQLVEKIAREKANIFHASQVKAIVYNRDDANVRQLADQVANKTKLSYGLEAGNDLVYRKYEVTEAATEFEFALGGKTLSLTIDGYLLPKNYREIFAAAILVASRLGIAPEIAVKELEKNFQLPPGRAGIFQGVNKALIIDSSYNASRTAVVAFLKLMFRLKQKTGRPTVFLFGDMRELGQSTEIEHKLVAGEILKFIDEISGLPYGKLLDELIIIALKRHSEKSKLQRTYSITD